MAAERPDLRPVFICGLGRSGTSWLARSLGESDELVYIGEAWLLSQLEALVEWQGTIWRDWGKFTVWKRMGVGPDQVAGAAGGFYEQLLLAASGGRRFVEKTPEWNLLRLDFLIRLFPRACYVLVYRDGRNQVASLEAHRRAIGAEFDFADASRRWAQGMEVISRYRRPPPGIAALTVRYEDMLEDFAKVFARVCSGVGIRPFRPPPHPPNSRFPGALQADDFNRRWADWPPDKIATFKREAGRQLLEWGYAGCEAW